MRRLLKLAILVALLLAVAGYIFHGYWPRERAASPEPGSLPARLLASGDYGACLWVPYPHQNLGVLAGAVGDGSAYLAAASREAGTPAPALPSFGPFAVPPSREIVACSDLDGQRFLLVARVYPGLAAVARLAGRLADNPWLRGGEVRETRGQGDEVQERALQVSWQDGLWMVRSGREAKIPEGGPGAGGAAPASLGLLHLAQEISDLPAGDYRLARQGGDLEVTLVGGDGAPDPQVMPAGPVEDVDAPVLLVVAGPAWPAAEPRPLPPAALALFDVQGGLKLGPLELPGAAVFNPPGGKRWGLPSRGLAGLLTDSLPRGNSAGWEVVALDTTSLARAQALAPGISALVPPDASGSEGRLVLGAWLRPRPAHRLVTQMRKGLEKVPLVDRRQVQRWRDWETLLGPFSSCDQASLAATRSPSSFRLRLHDCN
ncbi:MAG: hypothetical protein QOF89_2885 [Acidobacteriota bacterium]|jgi:hypothetical protein|nr:hypothetical protein [Acidobacteriota bacterium]